MGKDIITFIAELFDNLDSIFDDYVKLRNNNKIPEKVRVYVTEAFKNYLCGTYISACLSSTIAIEAALKHIHETRDNINKTITINGKTKKPERFYEFIEWAYQTGILPKSMRMFSDGMRDIRNDLAHASDYNGSEYAKLMIVSMGNILNQIYR